MIDANDKAKIEYGRDFDAVLDMTLFSLKDRVAASWLSRPTSRRRPFAPGATRLSSAIQAPSNSKADVLSGAIRGVRCLSTPQLQGGTKRKNPHK